MRSNGRAGESTAVRLLRRLFAADEYAPAAVSQALVISDAELTAYLEGADAMPLDRQLCLALFVIERVPSLARAGHQLRAQVAAAMAFENRVTETHSQPPASPTWRTR